MRFEGKEALSVDGENGIQFLFEDNHLLAAMKPSGTPSQPDSSGDASLDELAKAYLKRKYAKPGAVYLGLLHRLDRPTSGVVLMARTDKAASRMSEQFRKREAAKQYLAVVEWQGGTALEAECAHWLEPAGNGGMRVVSGKRGGAREARLAYRRAGVSPDGRRALLEVDLLTGVKHQIRCQLAALGCPVVGDFRYGPGGAPARPEPALGGRAILLHAWRLGFTHPVRREPVEIVAGIPPYWREYGLAHIDDGFRNAP